MSASDPKRPVNDLAHLLSGVGMPYDRKEQPKWLRYVAGVFLVIWIGGFSYHYVNPTSREDRAILANLSGHEILSVTVEPARSGYPSVISSAVVIHDKTAIGLFSGVLSKMILREPEHPKVTRAAILRIQLSDRVIGGYLEESSNDGTTFYCMSDITTGWVFGAYAVPKGAALLDAIEQLPK